MLKIGRYEATELDIEDYHADKETISRTPIMLYGDCPRKYEALYITKEMVKTVTPAMVLGSAFHTLILEPDLFNARYAIYPEGLDRRTRQGKIDYEAFCVDSSGKEVINAETMKLLNNMAIALGNHTEARALIWGEGSVFERSYVYGDDESGLIVKSRPDIIRPNCIVDLKTCRSAEEHQFKQSAYKQGNHVQGAMVQDAMRIIDGREDALTLPVINIAIETTAPHCIGIYFLSQASLEAGRERYKATLKNMKTSFESGVYPSYPTKEIDLPNWYNPEYEE